MYRIEPEGQYSEDFKELIVVEGSGGRTEDRKWRVIKSDLKIRRAGETRPFELQSEGGEHNELRAISIMQALIHGRMMSTLRGYEKSIEEFKIPRKFGKYKKIKLIEAQLRPIKR